LRIRLYVIADEEEIKPPISWIVNLADNKQVFDLFRGIGNYCFVEARAVGESADAIEVFRGLLTGGGYGGVYHRGLAPRPGSSWQGNRTSGP
jgi:hypothetical protein